MRIFKSFLVIFLFLTFAYFSANAEVTSSLWQVEKSQHFIIYYQEAKKDFVDEVISRAEEYYNAIVDNLRFRRMDFWSWDNRAKIYLYNNADDFHKDTTRSNWAAAVVSINDRTIRTFVGQKDFFDSILAHEMTHIIFREFIGKNIPLPLWIDEGIACSQEKSNLKTRMRMTKELINKGAYIKMDIFCESSDLKNTTPYVFYSQAASLMVFILREDGADGFFDFSRKLRDSGDWKGTLFSVYHFSGFDEMEQKWKEFMLKEG